MYMELKVCPVCGKKFIPATEHMYKTDVDGKTILTCSYTCWRKVKPTKSHSHYASRRREQG